MKQFCRLSLFGILMACGALTASAQATNWYYDQTTRYGTFRHYSNGGSKLVTTFRGQQDYAGQMAESYREAARAKEERERQRMIELERMGRQRMAERNRGSASSTGTPQKNFGPTPTDLARQEREEKERFYRQYEELLNNATGLPDQALILSQMYRLRPNDTTALRLFGVYAELGREEDMDR
ncbi:MAG: hypothetical protein EOO14_04970, partial [Chitinophagaceae bacterium]